MSGGDDSLRQQAADLGARIVGCPVTALYTGGVAHPALVGELITSVQPQGTHLLIGVGDGVRLHVHLGRSGRLRVQPRAALSLAAAARGSLVIVTEDVAAVWSNTHAVEVLQTASLQEHPLLSGLGPDVIEAAFDAGQAVARARARPPETTAGELMLDQRVVAGISNIGRNEALFLERMDPWTPLGRLPDDALRALYGRTRALMQADALPESHAAASRAGWVRPGRTRPHVYRRRGRPCHVCGTPIAAASQGAPPRSTYFCPRCQGHPLPAEAEAEEEATAEIGRRMHGARRGQRR